MDYSAIKFADMMNAARIIAFDSHVETIEDANRICASYGFSLDNLTDDEFKEFFRMVNSYLPKWI